MTSSEFAAWFGARRDQGAQHLLFAIGPADGWSQAALDQARSSGGLVLSFGPITMAHDLARLVLARPGGHQDPAYLQQVITADQVTVAVSANGGGSYTTLEVFSNDSTGSRSYDITPYIANNTRIRFSVANGQMTPRRAQPQGPHSTPKANGV